MISDEMVFAALNAADIGRNTITRNWMRAALEAIAPAIRAAGKREGLEEAAKEVEEWQVYFKHSGERASGEIANAIRAMAERATQPRAEGCWMNYPGCSGSCGNYGCGG